MKKIPDRSSLLFANTFHPTHLKKNLPISQFNQIQIMTSRNSQLYEWITQAGGTTQTECLKINKSKNLQNPEFTIHLWEETLRGQLKNTGMSWTWTPH